MAIVTPPNRDPDDEVRAKNRRIRRSLEDTIDLAYADKDTDLIILSVFSLVRRFYTRDRYVSGKGNGHLASIVSLELWRRLPWYEGNDKLTPYNGQIPLSHYVKMLAKSRRIDELRKLKSTRKHETLACDLKQLDGAPVDTFTYISNQHQMKKAPEQLKQIVQEEYESFLATVPARQRPALEKCIDAGEVLENSRKTFNKVIAGALAWSKRAPEPVVPCDSTCACWNCNKERAVIPPRQPRTGEHLFPIRTQRF